MPLSRIIKHLSVHPTFLLSFIHDFQETVDCFGSLKTQERMKGKMFTTLQKRILYCIYKRERWFKVRIWKTSLAYTTLKRQIAGDFFKVGETAANSSESCEDASCLETLFILARVSWQMFSLALLTSFSIQYSIVKKQTYLATFATVLKYIGCPFNNTFFFFRDLTSFMAFRMITKEKAEKCFRRWPVWILFSVSVIKTSCLQNMLFF